MCDDPLALCDDPPIPASWGDEWPAMGLWALDEPPIERPLGCVDEGNPPSY